MKKAGTQCIPAQFGNGTRSISEERNLENVRDVGDQQETDSHDEEERKHLLRGALKRGLTNRTSNEEC